MRQIQQVMRFLRENDRYNINVILCAPKHQTYQFAIPTRRVGYFIGTMILLGLWSVGSLGWIIGNKNANAHLKQQLIAANNALFDYQDRYEHVVERSYSVEEKKIAVLAAPAPIAADKIAPEIMPGADIAGSVNSPKNYLEGNIQVASTASALAIAQQHEAISANFKVKITSNIEKFDVNSATVSYTLQKLEGEQEVRGFLWGYAVIEDQSGNIRYSSVPETIDLLPPHEKPTNLSKTKHFQLTHTGYGHLFFTLNLASQESVSQIVMVVADEQGNIADKINIGMEQPFPTEAPTISRSKPIEPNKETL